MTARRRRRCDQCGALVAFVNHVERNGVTLKVCTPDLQRGDKVFHGYGPNDYTVFTYMTNARP